MIIVKKHIVDVLKHLEWFVNMNFKRKDVDEKVVSIENIMVDRMFGKNDRDSALKYIAKKLSTILASLDTGYNLYLMVNNLLVNEKSKVENYKRVWKYVAEEYDTTHFIFGDEVKIEFHGRQYYSSFAKVKTDEIENVLKIVSKNPDRNFILISKDDKYLIEGEVKKIFHKAFDNTSYKIICVDNYKLSLEIPKTNEMFIRWIDFGDEMEIGLVYNPDYIYLAEEETSEEESKLYK